MDRRDFLRYSITGLAASYAAPVFAAFGDLFPDPATFRGSEVFERIFKKAKKNGWTKLPMGELVGVIGLEFIGTPYVGNTLEVEQKKENAVVNLVGLDCVTFFENSLDFARMLKTGGHQPFDLYREVQKTRYRGQMPDGYSSRLHYTIDWLYENDRRAIVKDITPHLPGAQPFQRKIDFMSKHLQSYRQLANDPAMVEKMRHIEESISQRKMTYIPKDQIAMVESLLETGDIIGMTSSVEGLDINHTGLCYRDPEGALRYLNASSVAKKVILGPRLSEYAAGIKKDTGIVVARPLEPHKG